MWKDNPIRKFISQHKLRFRISTVLASVVFIYMFIATSEALWQNYQINQEITQLKLEITQLGQENAQLKNLIAYLKTESFREKEARRKLGYKKAGEKVVALPQNDFPHIEPGDTTTEDNTENQLQLSNPQKWWEYIFG